MIDELDRLGMPRTRQTILVAGGLERRASRVQLEALLRPEPARAFRGSVVTHDVTAEGLRRLGEIEGRAALVAPELLETDLVVTVTAAESVVHGGPSALVAASTDGLARRATSSSLLEPTTSPGWRIAVALEALLARHVAVIGLSLVLDVPRLRTTDGLPRRLHGLAPASVRHAWLQRQVRGPQVASVLAGTPSVAHAEALIRGTTLRGARVETPFDTLVVPLPWCDHHQPRSPLNPVTTASTALGIGLRLWRDRPPVRAGGTVVLLAPLSRTTGHGPQEPFRRLFTTLLDDGSGSRLSAAEALAARDPRALSAYRRGQAPHPRLPFADWESCAPALRHAGRVIVAGCRDAAAARTLGMVPSRNAAAALEMALGVEGAGSRTGVLLAPPYVPLLVGAPAR